MPVTAAETVCAAHSAAVTDAIDDEISKSNLTVAQGATVDAIVKNNSMIKSKARYDQEVLAHQPMDRAQLCERALVLASGIRGALHVRPRLCIVSTAWKARVKRSSARFNDFAGTFFTHP